MKKALILVDIQNDFCPGGALAVADGDAVVAVANRLQPDYELVVATQDWHPAGHESFASVHGKTPGTLTELHGLPQVLWPDHCVQGSRGAEFHPGLDMSRVAKIFHKGLNPQVDSYSGFYDNDHKQSTGLGDYLKSQAVTDVDVVGLATDYCVKFTALDAAEQGFKTVVLEDACRGVELAPGDVARALDELRSKGVTVTLSQAATG